MKSWKLISGAGGMEKSFNLGPGSQPRGPMVLRGESNGRKHANLNAKTMCKIDHLKNLALWAAAEASIPSLGAFFGERLAASNEALGLRSDPSLFYCERCESILQPGTNCTVRIEKNKSKGRRRQKKSNPIAQNNLVYRCHSCSHRNSMRGTPSGYVKEICPPKPKPTLKSKKAVENRLILGNVTTTIDSDARLPVDGQILDTNSPATPLPTTSLESKRRKRNRSSAKKVAEPQSSAAAADLEKSSHASSKKRKKSWKSLKEIAESSGQNIGKKLTDLTIPFFI